jgi:trk system potassium uptake protein TrkH
MFIGASPGSTGGGIKTTTFAIVMMSLWSIIRGMKDVVMFKRRIQPETFSKSFLLASNALLLIMMHSFLLMRIENANYLSAIFEVTSAFGTVGLSVGDGGVRSLSALFSPFGKLLITFTMFAGRLGPLTLAVAVIKRKEQRFRYPEGRIMIG